MSRGTPEAGAAANKRNVERVRERLREAIETAGGCLDFEQFMDIALYADGCGYYSASRAAPGAAGDFTTAPELAQGSELPVFAGAIAALLAPLLRAEPGLGLVEVGPGSGRLACDLLLELAAREALPRRYLMVERSPALAAIAAQRVAGLPTSVRALVSAASELPQAGLRDVVLANELLDALPVRRFQLDERGVPGELGVRWDAAQQGFALCRLEVASAALDARLAALLQALPTALAPGYLSELNLVAERWVERCARALEHGALLLIDYGYGRDEYYHPQRAQGTLRCFQDHRAHDDPLLAPGAADITAHVDFSAMAHAGELAGLELAGYQTQADFVMACGLLQAIESEHAARGEAPPPALAAQLRKLMLPGEMGELVKLMLLDRGTGLRLPGRDRRGRLRTG